MPMLHILFRRY